MFTVLLVDDEEYVLKNLTNAVNWPVYGIETVLTASDGLEAIEQIETNHVNLIIADISMPRMDGLQLVKHVRETYPYIRCVLLTSYSDFSYAKQAISLGVENYLLKPFKPEEMDNTIRKAISNIVAHKRIMQTVFLDNLLFRWVKEDISFDELSERAGHIGINLYFRNYCVLLFRSAEAKHLESILSAFIASVEGKNDAYHFIDHEGYHVMILAGQSLHQNAIADTLYRLIDTNGQITNLHISIGNIVENYKQVPSSYQSALDTLLVKPSANGVQINYANQNIYRDLSSVHINLITEYIKCDTNENEEKDSATLFRRCFPNVVAYKLRDINRFVDILAARIAITLNETGEIADDGLDTIMNSVYHFEAQPSEQEIVAWFTEMLSICQALSRLHKQQLSPIVFKAMRYISHNYASYISIKDFCQSNNINPSYLGLLFKKETGIYFNDYISQVRISQAISLLNNSSLKIADICKRCGFSNPSYFVVCFKKQVGISPAKYKQLHMNQGDPLTPASHDQIEE